MKISEINKNPKNPRKIKGEQLNKLMESIQRDPEFMRLRPIVIDENNMILGGNQRYTAIKKLGMKEIPDEWIARAENLTEEQRKRFILVDNGPEGMTGEWDFDALQAEWELPELESLGFDISEYEAPQEPNEGLTDADEIPEDPDPVCKLGDLWQLGEHRLLCGDSTKEEDVKGLMGGEKADMVFTDPPYGVDYDGGVQFTKEGVKKGQRAKLENDHSDDIYSAAIPILAKFCKGPCYVWFAGTKASKLYNAVEGVGYIHSLLIWVKNGGYGALNANYKQKHEPCLYWKPKWGKLNFVGATTETTIWNIDKDGVNKLHPTQKPVDLSEKAIRNHSAGLVLDLFLGSGSTLIACEKTNRKCYGMEIDPKYCDVIIKRWENFTGKKAEKL